MSDKMHDSAVTTSILDDAKQNDNELEKPLSIYDIHGGSKKRMLIIISCLGFLATFDEIIYVPALPQMVADFHTTETLGFLSISIYFFTIAVSSMFWGVLADYYGRKPTVTFGLIFFILSLYVCSLSTNIYIFLVGRGLQGCFISVTVIAGQAMVADIYSPSDRASAYGIFYAFYFSAGFLAPTVGGVLSASFGWRYTFIFVSAISFILLMSYVVVVPETLQYKVIVMYQNKRNISLLESDQVSRPTLTNPCLPFTMLAECNIIPYITVLICGFVTVNCAMLLLSTEVTKPPYLYREDVIGILFIPICVAYLSGSIIGGKVPELVANKFFPESKTSEVRMVPGLVFSLIAVIGLLIYGWTLQYRINIALVMLGQIFCAFGQTATRPGIMAYLTIEYQDRAAIIGSLINFLQQMLTAIVLAFIANITNKIGDGPFFTVLAALNLLSTVVMFAAMYRRITLSRDPEKKLLL